MAEVSLYKRDYSVTPSAHLRLVCQQYGIVVREPQSTVNDGLFATPRRRQPARSQNTRLKPSLKFGSEPSIVVTEPLPPI